MIDISYELMSNLYDIYYISQDDLDMSEFILVSLITVFIIGVFASLFEPMFAIFFFIFVILLTSTWIESKNKIEEKKKIY